MINNYPAFTKLDFTHKDFITEFTSRYEPYSDFNFVSLYSWSFENSAEISLLNDNLVIKLPDYITGKTVISILGNQKINQSMSELLSQPFEIKLVPEIVIKELADTENIEATPDRNNHDYIYLLEDQASLGGRKFKRKRNRLSVFLRSYEDRITIQEFLLTNEGKINELEKLFKHWAIERQRDEPEVAHEKDAILRLLDKADHFNLKCYEVLIDNKMVGFSINEILSSEYAVCHFHKSLVSYKDLDIFLSTYVAKQLLSEGCKFVNWEQDLGIEGLREAKESYYPAKYLNKYKISLKQ